MTPTRMQNRLRDMNKRYRALGGHELSLVLYSDAWAVTNGGGAPAIRGRGETAEAAFKAAEAALSVMEKQRWAMARDLGFTAEQNCP